MNTLIKITIYGVWIGLLIAFEYTQYFSEPDITRNKIYIMEIKRLSEQILNEEIKREINEILNEILNEEIKKNLNIKPISKDEIPEPRE